MPHLSLRVSDELIEELDAEADAEGVSRSDYIRNTLESRHRADELEARVEDLRRQLQEANSDNRDVDEIVAYVEEERTIQQRREEREQRRQSAPAWRRAKWWLLGTPEDEPDP